MSCAENTNPPPEAVESITAENLIRHIQTLSSDEFHGRAPSGAGEEKTINYLKEQFEKLGLQPGNNGAWFQEVGLVSINANPDMQLSISGNGQTNAFRYADEFMAGTRRMVEEISLDNSGMIFVGYGIVAPEYNWNDYAGLDVPGKTVVMLVNDPGYATGDSALFNGRAMTYYGRWTYKYEEAARQGAAAAVIIHETGPAGYPWEVVRNSWSGAQFYLESPDRNMSSCKVESWVTYETAKKIFQQAGLNLQELTEAAARRNFQAVPMNLQASIAFSNKLDQSKSKNVLALLPGTDLQDEIIVYTAHWDHLGTNSSMEGDTIFNGARDNATGTAALIEIARAFVQLPEQPRRSILFLPVTAEEKGLLGSGFYAENPVFPARKTVANLNMDALNIFGKMKDITVIGYGNSELDEYVERAARRQNRYVRPDPEPEKGGFYRSDHFSFAKKGIPALYTKNGIDHVEHGEEWTLEQLKEWTANHYHKPSDEYDPETWDLEGMVDDVRLLFMVGYELSMQDEFPEWREGTEFKATREADLANADTGE